MTHRIRCLAAAVTAATSIMGSFSVQAATALWYDEQLVDLQPATPTAVSPEGMILGQAWTWPCGATSACPAQMQWSVWRSGVRYPLPTDEGFEAQPSRIGPKGVVVGAVVDSAGRVHAARWQFDGTAYQLARLNEGRQGLESRAVAVNSQGWVVGWRRLPSGASRPTMWSAAGGVKDLIQLGFPAGLPTDMSPNGWVLTPTHRYRIGDVASTDRFPITPEMGIRPVRIDSLGRPFGLLQTPTTAAITQLVPGPEDTSGIPVHWMYLYSLYSAPSPLPTTVGGVSPDGTAVFSMGGEAYLAYSFRPDVSPWWLKLRDARGTAPKTVSMPTVGGIDHSNRPVVTLMEGGVTRMARLAPQYTVPNWKPAEPYVSGTIEFGTATLVRAVPGGGTCCAGLARQVRVTLNARRINRDGTASPEAGALVRAAVLTRAGSQALNGVTDSQGKLSALLRDVECDSPIQGWVQAILVDGVPEYYGGVGRRATQAAMVR